MTDESGQTYPSTAIALMDRALGSEGYYGAFVANIHTDGSSEAIDAAIVDAAQARDVPVVTAQQLLTWTDGRNASSFGNLQWNASSGELTFTVDVASGARGLEAMVPHPAGGTLLSLTGPNGAIDRPAAGRQGRHLRRLPRRGGQLDRDLRGARGGHHRRRSSPPRRRTARPAWTSAPSSGRRSPSP